ncbi:5987_t:CDS:2, partial [Rhizophagus irregularis]
FAIGKKFSNKFLKNLEKNYRPISNDEDIYLTYSSSNKNKFNMTSSQPAAPSQTANNTSTDTTMEEATTSSPTHALSHNEIELTSRDSHEQDVHTQTPITDKLTNMDVDPIDTNTDKGKSPETQSATQTNTPNPLHITVLTDIFTHTPQVSNKIVMLSDLTSTQRPLIDTLPSISEHVTRSTNT